LLVSNSKVTSVYLFKNAALLKRRFEVDLPSGYAEITVDNLEPTLHPDSIRIYTEPRISVLSHEFFTYKKLLKDILPEEEKELREKIKELQDKKFKLGEEIKSLRTLSSSLDLSFFPLMLGHALGMALGRTSGEEFRGPLSTILEERKKVGSILSERMRELEELNAELEGLKSRLEKISGETLDVGSLRIETSSEGGRVLFEIAYNLNNAYWSPTYDVLVGNGKVKVIMYANLFQDTPYKWEDVSLRISSKPIAKVVKPLPLPCYIRPLIPEKLRMAEAAMEKAKKLEEEVLAEEVEKPEMAMELARVWGGEYVSYEPKGTISVEPKKSKQIALEELEFESKIRYVWDAYTQPGFVSIIEFINADRSLLPGKYRVYQNDLFIGTGELPLTSPKQKVEMALTSEDRLETKRQLIMREEEKKGVFLKGMAYIKMGFRLTIINHKGKEVELRVYDRIPVSEHPEIHVELSRSEPKPDKLEMGILEWNFKLKPGEEKKIEYAFTIKYPPELTLRI